MINRAPLFATVLFGAILASSACWAASGRIEVVPDFCSAVDVNGVTDNTPCLQSAIRAAASQGGGVLHIYGNFVVQNLVWDSGAASVWLEGDGSDNSGASITLAPGSQDGFSIGWVVGGGIRNLLVNAGARSGGYWLNCSGCTRFNVEDVRVETPFLGMRYYSSNNDLIRNVLMNHISGSGWAIEWVADTAQRSDILTIENTLVQAAPNQTASCFHMMGNVNTAAVHGMRCLNVNYGFIAERDVTGTLPFGGIFDDLEIDFPRNEAVRIMDGEEWQFSNCYMNGSSSTADLITFGPAATNLMISTSKMISANYSILGLYGKGAVVSASQLGYWGRTTGAAAVTVHPGATGISVGPNIFTGGQARPVFAGTPASQQGNVQY